MDDEHTFQTLELASSNPTGEYIVAARQPWGEFDYEHCNIQDTKGRSVLLLHAGERVRDISTEGGMLIGDGRGLYVGEGQIQGTLDGESRLH